MDLHQLLLRESVVEISFSSQHTFAVIVVARPLNEICLLRLGSHGKIVRL